MNDWIGEWIDECIYRIREKRRRGVMKEQLWMGLLCEDDEMSVCDDVERFIN